MKPNFMRRMNLLLVTTVLAAGNTMATDIDLSNVPMGNTISPSVKPNIMLILDRSGSMGWSHMPDRPLNTFASRVGYRSAQCNGVYFDPTITYDLPVKADGTTYPPATFTAAWNDGYNAGSGTVNLSTSFRAYTDGTIGGTINTLGGSGMGGNDTAQAAYYYQYNGAGGTSGAKQPAMGYEFNPTTGAVVANTFYNECNTLTTSADIGAAATHTWTKVTVGAADQQNFANWYSYYRTRINMMKSATGLALKQLNAPNYLRLGLVYHDFSSFTAIADYSDTTGVVNTTNCTSATTQRARLYCRLYAATASGGTPTRTALSKVGRIYEKTLVGYADPVQFKCQRNSTILATDGFWNGDCGADCGIASGFTSVGNQDLGGTAPFNDTVAASTNSMADIALYFYKTHIRSTLDNPPPPATDKAIPECPQVPKEGWVRQTPRDCATHVHMNTFTLGLGANGSLRYVYGYETPGTSPDYDAIVAGTKTWPNPVDTEDIHRMDDLWHAAVNGRGLYFAASNPGTLSSGLKQAFAAAAEIGAGSAPAVPSVAVSAGDHVFGTTFKNDEWTGDMGKYPIDEKTGDISVTSVWSTSPAAQLDALPLATRKNQVYMAKSGSLALFNLANLSTAVTNHWFDAGPTNPNGALEQYQFFSATQIAAATPQKLIDFIVGDRSLEDEKNLTTNVNPAKLFRGRVHILGDMVNSSPVYVGQAPFEYTDPGYAAFISATAGRSPVVYVGANDGMLHAFDAATGAEKWAFVPTAILPYLYKLADKNYNVKHRYYVDGWITVGDANLGTASSPSWRTVLIGGLGKGGRAYYALDVTDGNSPQLLWEFASASTGTTNGTWDADLGYTPDGAQITKMKGGTYDGQWVATFVSGYNNTSPGDGQARLFVVDLKTGVKLAEIVTAGGTNPLESSIGWIQGWTDDGMKDNSSKDIYGGDMYGRVWRFDTAAQTATLLTTLGNPPTWIQPVTSRIELGEWGDDIGQRVIYVGTGRYRGYCDIDPSTPNDNYPPTKACPAAYYPASGTAGAKQSIYAIRDVSGSLKSNIGGAAGFRSVAAKLANGNRNSSMTYNDVSTNSNGWYLDFDAELGERVTIQPRLIDWNNLVVFTNVPANDPCAVGGTSYVYSLETQVSNTTHTVQWFSVGGALAVGGTNMVLKNGEPVIVVSKSDGTTVTIKGGGNAYGDKVRRVSWRELAD